MTTSPEPKKSRMSKFQRILPLLAVAGVLAPAAQAQFNNTWATFTNDTNNRLKNPNGTVATQVTTDTDEKDYAWGDLNKDGWTDLIVVRKQPAATLGKRVNQLLMNEQGVLVDRTSQYAVDTDVGGDFGFSTATNDRDVAIADFNGDGWLDVVTATTLSDGDTKVLSHPRVYMNKGSINGVWQGLRFENARIPQLQVIGTGLNVAPRFCAVTPGDVDHDGDVDLYFVDYDRTETNIAEPTTWDLNDRLLLNDGTGFFTDSLETRLNSAMLLSTFGTAAEIVDLNGDGWVDILKNTALDSLIRVSAAYNDPANVGTYVPASFQTNAGTGTPYHIDTGDLNNDGRVDLVVGDDGTDYYRYNLSTDALGRVNWGPQKAYTLLGGQVDDGFPGNTIVADLNADGWKDVIQTDVDVDLPGCSRRTHIYHNPGGAVGSQITLVEEAQNTGTSGWKGVVGMTIATDLRGTFDVAVFDIDNDGDNDMVFGRCTGTSVWINQLFQPATLTAYCFGDGTGTACPCGNNSAVGDREGCLSSLGTGGRLNVSGIARITNDTFKLSGSRMGASPALYFQATTQLNGGLGNAFGDGLRCAGGATIRLAVKVNSAAGESSYPGISDLVVSVKGGAISGSSLNYQTWYRDSASFCSASTFNLTNAYNIVWAP